MAINLSRASRTNDRISSQTSPVVGPGTYSSTHNDPKPPKRDGLAPFSTLQERVLNQDTTTSAITPGPGNYGNAAAVTRTGRRDYKGDVPSCCAASFKSKAPRLGPRAPGSTVYTSSTIEKNPGPGTYMTGESPRRQQKDLCGPVKPVLEVAERTVPSIPASKLLPRQIAEAQEMDDVTRVLVRHTGDRGDTVGPGEYDARTSVIARSQRSTAFHRSRIHRSMFDGPASINSLLPPREAPGPGAYEIKGFAEALARSVEEGEAVSTYQFSSKSARKHVSDVAADRVPPGPGQYDIASPIDTRVKSARERGSSQIGGSQFGSVTERTSTLVRSVDQPYKDPYNSKGVPGPAHYADPVSCFGEDPRKAEAQKALAATRKKKIHAVHHPAIVMALADAQGPLQAFNSTDDRPCNKVVDQRTPAPWQYSKENARGCSMASELREKAKVGRRGAFGTCADRFYGSPLAGQMGLLDQGTEGGGGGGGFGGGDSVAVPSGAYREPRAVFQSATPRFTEAPGPREEQHYKVGNHDTPAPGAYETMKEVSYRSPFRQPRADHLSFGTSGSRFDYSRPPEGGMAKNPGPGEYSSPVQAIRRSAGVSVGKAQRANNLVGCTDHAVGPGSYTSTLDTHMLKKTFNVTTGHVPAPSKANAPSQMSRSA